MKVVEEPRQAEVDHPDAEALIKRRANDSGGDGFW